MVMEFLWQHKFFFRTSSPSTKMDPSTKSISLKIKIKAFLYFQFLRIFTYQITNLKREAMRDDFPDPVLPTMAIFCPGFATNVISLSVTSPLIGYLDVTWSKRTSPSLNKKS
jgi:hypothetical protein